MHRELRQRIKEASEKSGIDKLDFIALLKLIDEHYDKMEATITQSLATQTLTAQPLDTPTPIDLIFDSVTDALLSVSDKGTIRNCNKVCARYFGITKEELIGSPVSEILPDIEDQSLAEYLQPFMSSIDDANADSAGGEVRAARKNGDFFVAEINASSLMAGDTQVFVINLRDVTGRKEVEKTLRENEERYRALVENAPEAIVVLDVDSGRFVDTNDYACQLFNLSRSRLLNVGPKAISPRMQPDGTPSFGIRRGYVERALNGEHPIFEWLHKDSSGKHIPCEVRFSRLPAGARKLIRVSITDISDRKRDDEFTFAQNKILEMIAASTPFERTLRAICHCIEKIDGGMRAAVMQLDVRNQVLNLEYATSLPEEFKLALDFIKVGPSSRACGAAVFENKDKFVGNIAEDESWAGQHELLKNHQIAAVWSFPLRGAATRIIGALDIYLDQPRLPTTDELDKLGRMARLAGIAVKKQLDEKRLKNSESRYRSLFENVVEGVYIASRDGHIITVNPALVNMLGYDSADDLKAAGRTTMLYVNPVDRERVFAQLEAEGVVKNFEYRLRRKDGEEIVVLENSRAVCDEDGTIIAHEGTITDITERKKAETRVFREKERAQVTLQSIGDGVITTDAEGCIDYINPVAQNLTGWDVRSARGKPVDEVMTIINEHTRATVDSPVMRCLKENRVITLADNSVLINQEGVEIPIQDSAAPIRDRIGNMIGAVMVFHDVSKESRLFRQLSYQASHDALTGLINRQEFENRIVTALENSRANPSHEHALLYIDLDQFKVVNDTFGHTAGDELLRQVMEVIQGKIRSTDTLARLGGDEFGILLERCQSEQALEIAEAIRGAIDEYRFNWQDTNTKVRCSIGMYMVTSESPDAASIMSFADVACYSAKDMGRNQIHLYQDSDASVRHEEMKWVSRITSAVEENRLELYFQPIIGIGKNQSQARGHYELLLRMRDENGVIVGPDQFIPAAERYNLMSTLDRWVIREALSQLADKSPESKKAHFTLAINLSGTSLSEDRFLEYVIDELQKHTLPDGAICFEITETAAISNLSRVVHFMNTLKKVGCKFSLDDFGSGLSSFTYLKNLPVDFLKIDGQFIRNVAGDSVDESMVRAINQVGNAMGIATIAERVETKEVLDKLSELGVEYAQGYYIAKPCSVQSFEPWAELGTSSKLA
jgi:diguanylate cyclase (GGDEF)-like protein/PAS domain S-box-containing protein